MIFTWVGVKLPRLLVRDAMQCTFRISARRYYELYLHIIIYYTTLQHYNILLSTQGYAIFIFKFKYIATQWRGFIRHINIHIIQYRRKK